MYSQVNSGSSNISPVLGFIQVIPSFRVGLNVSSLVTAAFFMSIGFP